MPARSSSLLRMLSGRVLNDLFPRIDARTEDDSDGGAGGKRINFRFISMRYSTTLRNGWPVASLNDQILSDSASEPCPCLPTWTVAAKASSTAAKMLDHSLRN